MMKHYLFIVNPNAAKGKAGKDWLHIERLIRQKDIYYKAVLTSGPGHAVRIVEEELSLGYKSLIVVGGDGTVNEVVNGIFHQKIVPPEEISLGIIPVGTGNDWARYYGIPEKYKKALEYLFTGEAHFQDVGKLTHSVDGKPATHYFVNIAGFGFDAVVVKATNEMQERGNRMAIAYLFNLLRTALSYRSLPMTVEINGETISRKIFSISIGNGRFSGGGMKQTPNAVIDDGLFDVTLYDDMSLFKIVRNVLKLYSGKILKVPGVHAYKTKRLIVQDGPELLAEVDGEIIPEGPFEIEMLPSALKVLV